MVAALSSTHKIQAVVAAVAGVVPVFPKTKAHSSRRHTETLLPYTLWIHIDAHTEPEKVIGDDFSRRQQGPVIPSEKVAVDPSGLCFRSPSGRTSIDLD